MRGHVRQRGRAWSFIIDLGNQKGQRCGCGARFWLDREPLEVCPKCGGELSEREERRQREQGGFKTRKEAEAALATALSNLRQGSYIEPAKMTLKELSGAHLNAFYAKLLTQGENDGKRKLSPATVRRIHATLHKALADAVRWNKIVRSPAQAADPPRSKAVESRQMKTWTAAELRGFLESATETRLYPLWLTLASTGLRRGEALGLRWEDVDMENSRLSIQQNRVSVGHEIIIGKPKTGHGRNVSLDPVTVATLKSFRTQQKKERLRWPGYVDSGYVFVRENGEPYHPNLVSHAFEAAVKTSKQPRIRLHDLRHTHATLALSAGVHPKVVSERLGHASIMITLDTYSHAIPALQEEAAAKIAALFMPF